MKVVIGAGSPGSHVEQVMECLYLAGLEHPKQSDNENSPQRWFDSVVDAYELGSSTSLVKQVTPGKLWERSALGILEDNIQSVAWGFGRVPRILERS